MKITKTFDKIEKSAVKLSVTIAKADVAEAYSTSLTKYSKELQ